MSLKGKKIAIMVDEQYQELEVWYPYFRLKEEQGQVDLIGPEKAVEYKSKLGYPATADKAAGEVK